VLSVAKIARGRFTYYLETVAAGREPGDGLVEPDGSWIGARAAALGLGAAPVDRPTLGALLDGVDPLTGEVLDPGHGRVRVAAFDCTFAAPKSVSIVHALSADDAVVAEVALAHERSVVGAVGYLEDEAGRVRRRAGGTDRVVASGGLAAAAFVHRTSRAPDPHLHSHVLVANLGCDEHGTWSALDARALFVHARTAGALYRAQLRAELVSRLGVTWRWRDDGFADLAGVPPEAVRAFSRRREQISAELVSQARLGPAAARVAAARTRRDKDVTTTYTQLADEWRSRASGAGITARAIAAAVPGRSRVDLDTLAAARRTRRESPRVGDAPFTRRTLVAERAQSLEDGGAVADIVGRVDAELGSAIARGAVLADPDRATVGARLRRRAGGRIPSGVVEPVLVTAEYLERERDLARRVAAARSLGAAPLVRGLWRPAAPTDAVFEVGAEVARALARAVDAHRPVLVIAPSGAQSAHAEAVLGLRTVAPRAAPALERYGVVVAIGADAWPVADLDGLVARADASASSLVLVATGAGRGRSALREAVERGWTASGLASARRVARPPCEVPVPLADVRRAEAGRASVVLVDDPTRLEQAVLDAHARLRREHGDATIVVADARARDSLARATGPGTRVVPAARSARAAAVLPRGGLVVVGGAALLGSAAGSVAHPRVHVAVAPPGTRAGERERWAAHLASGAHLERFAPGRGSPARVGPERSARTRPGGPEQVPRAPGAGLGLGGR